MRLASIGLVVTEAATGWASLSTVTLEDDALVRPSPLLEDLGEAGLAVAHEVERSHGRDCRGRPRRRLSRR